MKLLNILALLVLSSGLVQAQVTGPVFPPEGGVTFSSIGGSPGDSGGTDFIFIDFDPNAFNALYWGPQNAGAVAAGLDWIPHTLNFAGISGITATWAGQTNYYRPPPGPTGLCTAVPVYLEITVTNLGLNPWIPASTVPGLDPNIGAVVDNSLGDDFTANLQFWADLTGCYDGVVPLNTVPQYPGNRTVSEFFGGFFYSTAPAVTCTESFNPAGKNIPKAGKGGRNEDGFYLIEGFDLEEGDLDVLVENADGSYIFGPFQSGSIVKITEAPGATPSAKLMGGPNSAVAAHIKLDSDALVVAFDSFGSSQVNCLVPPPPK